MDGLRKLRTGTGVETDRKDMAQVYEQELAGELIRGAVALAFGDNTTGGSKYSGGKLTGNSLW